MKRMMMATALFVVLAAPAWAQLPQPTDPHHPAKGTDAAQTSGAIVHPALTTAPQTVNINAMEEVKTRELNLQQLAKLEQPGQMMQPGMTMNCPMMQTGPRAEGSQTAQMGMMNCPMMQGQGQAMMQGRAQAQAGQTPPADGQHEH